ncbi:MAG: alpha-amylase [Desulfurococcaceae archaeon]|nr:alpha-amylase [Desulfurococcaceae archaeon]
MVDVVFVFEVHQPFRLKRNVLRSVVSEGIRGKLSFEKLFDILFDSRLNEEIFTRVAERCYVRATRILLDSIRAVRRSGRDFKFTISMSGVVVEQALRWDKRVIDAFQEAVSENAVEFAEQTYYHSLASLFSPDEFAEQILLHKAAMKQLFGVEPAAAENTEFIYNNDIAYMFNKLGYSIILTEGCERVLGWRSPNYVYRARGCNVRILMRNYRLSDDVGFRFSDRSWDQYPLTASKYASWIASTPGDVILIAMDYETFGEHHHPSTGILDFLKWLPIELAKHSNVNVVTPSEATQRHQPRDFIDVPVWETISWADERDLSAWLGNNMQRTVFDIYASLEPYVKAVGGDALRIWRYLGSSDHLYYMATKIGPAGDVHHYFSPYKDVFLAYSTMIEALTMLVTMVLQEISSKPRAYAYRIVLPYSKAFQFYMGPLTPLPYKAKSLKELIAIISSLAPPESLAYHVVRGDLAKWLREAFFLDDVAKELEVLGARVKEGYVEIRGLREELLKILAGI